VAVKRDQTSSVIDVQLLKASTSNLVPKWKGTAAQVDFDERFLVADVYSSSKKVISSRDVRDPASRVKHDFFEELICYSSTISYWFLSHRVLNYQMALTMSAKSGKKSNCSVRRMWNATRNNSLHHVIRHWFVRSRDLFLYLAFFQKTGHKGMMKVGGEFFKRYEESF